MAPRSLFRGKELPVEYIANPVQVDAARILEVTKSDDGGYQLILSEPISAELGRLYFATEAMCARMVPAVGDYVVRQADGYIYLNPKEVFERKYRAAEQPAVSGV
jgi:hypothetical protein